MNSLLLGLFVIMFQVVALQAMYHQEDEREALNARHTRSIYRRLPVYGLDEVPRDSRGNCKAFCEKLYSKLLKNSFYFQACIGVCATIDECSTVADCVAGTVCINTAEGLGYLCQCPSGFTGDGRSSGDGCIDVDECSSEPMRCVGEATCSNTEGSFICQCPFGYIGDGRSNGNGCTDITAQFVSLIDTQINIRISEAACSQNDCVAEATCIDSIAGGPFICTCPTGLMGDGRINGSGCMADECSTIADCTESASCINSIDGFVCLCQSGFLGDGRISGSNCVPDECSTVADCSVLASCSNSIDGFVCTCRTGYEGDGTISGTGCTDIDECAESSMNDCVPEATCSNTEGSFACICPPSAARDDTLNGREGEGCVGIVSIPECGPGDWFSVIRFNVSDPEQNCPANWQERTTPVRACERPMSPIGTCIIGFEETVSRPFTRVAGRAVGYQVGTTDAFLRTFVTGSVDLTAPYVDGLSITYSTSMNSLNHIWTFAAASTESSVDMVGCPCVSGLDSSLPAFLQDSYFCESGVADGVALSSSIFYDSDPLWDGEDCEGQCCTGSFATVPTFCTTVEEVEDATIRVRICTDDSTENENVAIESLEIFVQ